MKKYLQTHYSPEQLIENANALLVESANQQIHDFLKLGHRTEINQVFSDPEQKNTWLTLLVQLIRQSGFHTGQVFQQRAHTYAEKPVFQVIHDQAITPVSYGDAWKKIQHIANALTTVTKKNDQPVIGIFTPNSLEGALIDLACLSFGFRVVPIPANSTLHYLDFIINHASITDLFIGGETPSSLFIQLPADVSLSSVVLLPNATISDESYILWDDFLAQRSSRNDPQLKDRLNRTDMDEIATIMYTSGTTANPKGIVFTQTNLISKRFARALAIPDMSSDDTLLAFLPLYHTFGRYLELMGSMFHGATYTFAESTMFKTLLKDFSVAKPTVFISIPKRWIQIHEQVSNQIPIDDAKPELVRKTLHKLTGGHLRIGLSAAGYLDPDLFQFYHQHGITLLSGYGMTEATGGITMTPVDDYVVNSVGKPLPGVELSLGEDNELLLRGPYISKGYFGKTITPALKNGWFHTGDIFEKKNGHYFILDRKKEIYKNSRGQTISPQRIENMFQDFEAIKSVFLVGDMKEYNTLLIYPDRRAESLSEPNSKPDDIRELFGSLVQSVNSFLSPYERIVNFAIIRRDFSSEHGELTPKSTYKRKQILKNFSDIIEPMYEKHYLPIIHDEMEIRIPKWLMREKGIISTDITWDGKSISAGKSSNKLTSQRQESHIKFGDFLYAVPNNITDMEDLLRSPDLWLGNQELVDFTGQIAFRISNDESMSAIQLHSKGFTYNHRPIPAKFIDDLKHALRKHVYTLRHLHQAGFVLIQDKHYGALIALNYLHQTLEHANRELQSLAVKLLMRTQSHPVPRIRVKSLEYLLPHITGELFLELLINTHKMSHSSEAIEDMILSTDLIQKTHFDALLQYLGSIRLSRDESSIPSHSFIQILLKTVSQYGKKHPTSYIWARAELIYWHQPHLPELLQTTASEAFDMLTLGFRSWLGKNHRLAIDRETGEEYTWKDVVTFDSNVDESHRRLLLEVLRQTPMLREAVFLFSKRRLIQLDDILQRGIWISFLGSSHGKSVFRVLAQTREGDAFNFVVNASDTLDASFIQDEIRWLVKAGSSYHGDKLVEDFGGYWPEFNLYTEEYISGETLQQYLVRNQDEIAEQKALDRWQMRWLHFIWNGLKAYFEFYRRSDQTLTIAHPSPANLIIPEFDYSIGTRLISISNREQVQSTQNLFFDLYEIYIRKTEENFPGLYRMADWEIVFTAALEVMTVKKGVILLRTLISELDTNKAIKKKAETLGLVTQRIEQFIEEINENGVLTKPVVFASLRYERWLNLNPHATIKARGAILQELYREYRLKSLLNDYPETRIRFFRMTCFKDSASSLSDKLLQLQIQLRAGTLQLVDLDAQLQSVIESGEITDDEQYFLTRLLFEHLDAAQDGELISWNLGDKGRLDLISMIEDKRGEMYKIRPPFHPKEIARFHTILTHANLSGRFQQCHEFLLMINQNNKLVGGIYWKELNAETAHIEKIVIRSSYRKRHLSIQLLGEFFHRLQNRRYTYVTVGFFQAGLFYKHGFQIDKKFGGLVKTLNAGN
ncbi:MAG: GNAT family N-acetyltransferase [Candidatus Marinimicrobia bacterium]|nr:GNAT family N-acetyltransferase [Candidatus Neomarinimicrobiota bacterium]